MMVKSNFKRAFLFSIFVLTVIGSACTRSLLESLPTPTTSSQGGISVEGFTTPTPTEALANGGSISTSAVSTPGAVVPSTTTAQSTGSAPADYPRRLAVFNLAEGEVLNVRSQPSVNGEIIGTLKAGTTQIEPTGKTEMADNFTWQEINLPADQDGPTTGWVSAAFMAEEVPPDVFCTDARVGQVLDRLTLALRVQDGTAFSNLVSPAHGLKIIPDPSGGTVVSIDDPGELAGLFRSSFEYTWGDVDGTALTGSFSKIILPQLNKVFGVDSLRYCNSLENGQGTGPTTSLVDWPYDFGALNFVAMYAENKADQSDPWRTWAVGIDYVNAEPYISILVQYR